MLITFIFEIMTPNPHAEGITLFKKFSVVIALGALVIGGLGANMVKNMMDNSYMTSSEKYELKMPKPLLIKDKRILPICVDGAVGRWIGCSL